MLTANCANQQADHVTTASMGSSSSKPEDIASQKAREAREAADKAIEAEQAAQRLKKKAEKAQADASKTLAIAKKELDPKNIEACEKAIHDLLDKELTEMKDEVTQVEEIIQEGTTVKSIGDAVLFQYEDLVDTETIKGNIAEVCSGFPAVEVLIDAAASMIAVVQNTHELKKLFRWQQRKIIQRIKGDDGRSKVVGLELHYKVKIVEDTIVAGALKKVMSSAVDFLTGSSTPKEKKKTIVMVAYKIIAKNMPVADADKFLSKNELDAITF